jgi:hypothetical protein
MATGISKPSKYAVEWKKVRQTRLKASGMTALLEGLDRQWREYDGPYFVKNVMGNNALNDIKRNVDTIEQAKVDVSGLGSKFTKDYDKKEKQFIKDFVADMDHELNFWKETKRTYLLAGASADTANEKLKKSNTAYQKAFDTLKEQAEKLDLIYKRLHAADKLGDHNAPPAVLTQLCKGVEEFQSAWTDVDARNTKRNNYAREAEAAHNGKGDAPELHQLIRKIYKDYPEDRKTLNVMSTDAKIWLIWVKKQLGTH